MSSADFDQDTTGPQEWEVDPKYEFNAPKFTDFTKVDTAEDSKADEWFGKDRAPFFIIFFFLLIMIIRETNSRRKGLFRYRFGG